MTKTHAALGVAATSFVMSTADPVTLYVAGFATLLPDVDTSTSLLGRVLYPLARFIEDRFPHRTLTHSFLATAMLAGLAWPLRWVGHGAGQPLWRALVLGYFFGWFGDVFTKSGVAAFYPATSARLVIPRNPRLRLSTGTRGEYGLFAVLICLLVVSVHLNTEGGLMRAFSTILGQPEGATALFQKEGARRQIIATIEGRSAATQQRVVLENAEIIELDGQSLLVRDRQGTLYQAGNQQMCPQCQVMIDRVRARLGPFIETQTQEVRFQDQELKTILGSLRAPEGARVIFTGDITLKDAPLLVWPQSLQHFNAVKISGGDVTTSDRKVTLHAASLEEVQKLSDYFGSGNLLIKVVKISRQ